MTTFTNPINSINAANNEKEALVIAGREHFEGVVSALEFYAENGCYQDSHEHYGKTRRDLLEEGYSRQEVREIEEVLNQFADLGDFNNYGLSFDFVEADEDSDAYYRFVISWGGPSSEIRFHLNLDTEAVYQDWFCGVCFNVTTHEDFIWLRMQFEELGMLDFESKDVEELYQEYN